MNKTIAILIFTFFLGCNAFAQAPQSVPPPDTAAPVVTITQQQLDSLVSAAACGNQMELIAKQEAERMFDSYTTHVSWVVGLLGVLITILVAVSGFFVPYMTNKRFQEEMDEKIAAHDNEIEQSRQSLYEQIRKNEQLMSELEGVKNHIDQVEASSKGVQEQIKQSEARTRESAKEAKAWALFSWARQLDTHDSEQLDRKIEIYTRAINEFTQFPEALFNRGNAYSDKGEYDKAIQDYNEAIKLNPQYAAAYINRGIAYRNKGEYDKAIQDYSEAIKLNPQYAAAYNNRGIAYMHRGKEGDYALAKADFEKGLTLNPDETLRQKLQRNLRDVEDKMNGKTDSAPTQ